VTAEICLLRLLGSLGKLVVESERIGGNKIGVIEDCFRVEPTFLCLLSTPVVSHRIVCERQLLFQLNPLLFYHPVSVRTQLRCNQLSTSRTVNYLSLLNLTSPGTSRLLHENMIICLLQQGSFYLSANFSFWLSVASLVTGAIF
jgi:hypothetical protein